MNFQAGPPVQEPIEEKPKETDTKPKRPRGRPRNDGQVPGTVPPTPRVISSENRQPAIAGLLMTINFGLMLVPPLSRDQLDEAEILALSTEIAEEAKRNARFGKLVDQAISVTGAGGLVTVIALILGRRASRHGILPPEADVQLGTLLVMTNKKIKPDMIVVPQPVWGANGTSPETSGTADTAT